VICNAEMPSVQRLHDDFKAKQTVILIISVDGDGLQSVKPYMTKGAFTMPSALDSKLVAAQANGVLGTPTTFVTNRRAEIVAKGFGPIDFDKPEFRNYLQALIDQK